MWKGRHALCLDAERGRVAERQGAGEQQHHGRLKGLDTAHGSCYVVWRNRSAQMTKRCSKCGSIKSVDEFCSNMKWLSRISWCKACRASSVRKSRAAMSDLDRQKESLRAKEYLKAHPWVLRSKRLNRSVNRRGYNGMVTANELKAAWEKFNCKCWVCGDAANETDHFRPLNGKGRGKHEAANVRPICTECNHKRDRAWRGVEKANKEAVLLRQLKQMLHG